MTLFKCDWADTKRNLIDSKYGNTLIDLDHTVEEFVLPNQVMQAFYVKDKRDRIGVLPTTTKLKGRYVCDDEHIEDESAYFEFLPNVLCDIDDVSEDENMED